MNNMRIIKTLICIFMVLGALILPAYREVDVVGEQAEALETDKLEEYVPDDASVYMDGMSIMDSLDLGTSVSQIINNASGDVGGFLKNGAKSAVMLLAVVLLCGVIKGMYDGTDSVVANYVPLAGALAVVAISAVDFSSLIGLGRDAIDSMDTFSKALLPTLAAAAAASGAAVSATAKQVATAFFADILITVIKNLLLPLVYAYIAVAAADAAVGNGVLKRIGALIKSFTIWALSLILAAFTAYLTLSGVISGTTDAVALKATKTVISSAVPVVGGIISDASESILIGAGVLRNAIGVFGAIAVIAICIAPFLRLSIHYIMYKIAAAVSSTIGDEKIIGLIDNLASAFGIVLGMTASCALLLFISLISTISAVTVT